MRLTREDGLHARPAALLVSQINKYPNVEVRLEKDGKEVNGRSLTAILTLQGEKGDVIGFYLAGEGEEVLWEELLKLLEGEQVYFERI